MASAFRNHKPRPVYKQPVNPAKEFPKFEPIPYPQPGNCSLPLSAIVGGASINTINNQKQIVFHAVGDTGGINGTEIQEAVAETMESQFQNVELALVPSFFYHLGDVIYYNGQSNLYEWEFYDPYKFYPAPIFAIPGNHDGDTHIRKGNLPDDEPSLYGFFQNFCAPTRQQASTYRDAITQPYAYWELAAPYVTIIGLYGNIDGMLDGIGKVEQRDWLIERLNVYKQANKNQCLIIAVHQPPYSLDRSHGGYPYILDALDHATQVTGVWPHAVLSGHVHNYQRFNRHVTAQSGAERDISYIIAGAGGYANVSKAMHKLQRDSQHRKVPCPLDVDQPGVSLRGYNEKVPGFLRVKVTETKLIIEYYTVPFDGRPSPTLFDSVTIDCATGSLEDEGKPGTSGAE